MGIKLPFAMHHRNRSPFKTNKTKAELSVDMQSSSCVARQQSLDYLGKIMIIHRYGVVDIDKDIRP